MPETSLNYLILKRNRTTEIFLRLWLQLTRMMKNIIMFRTLHTHNIPRPLFDKLSSNDYNSWQNFNHNLYLNVFILECADIWDFTIYIILLWIICVIIAQGTFRSRRGILILHCVWLFLPPPPWNLWTIDDMKFWWKRKSFKMCSRKKCEKLIFRPYAVFLCAETGIFLCPPIKTLNGWRY